MMVVCDRHASCQFSELTIGDFFVTGDYAENAAEHIYIKIKDDAEDGLHGVAFCVDQIGNAVFLNDATVYPIRINSIYYSYQTQK